MALLEVKATPRVYELHRVTDISSQKLVCVSSDERGARTVIARLHSELATGADGSGVTLAQGYDRLATLRLRDLIIAEEDRGHSLDAFADELGDFGWRMQSARL